MEKIIYHGSDHILSKPKFGYGKTYNDYGVGFYCTENPNMAKEWGFRCSKSQHHSHCTFFHSRTLALKEYDPNRGRLFFP